MKFLVSLLTVILILGTGNSIVMAGNSQLDQPYSLTLGDWLAFQLSDMIRNNEELDDPTNVTFDKTSDVILIEIFGKRKKVNNAKEAVMDCWNFVQEQHIPSVEKNYDITLLESDYVIVYFNKRSKDGPTEIIRLEEGNLLLPQE
jgi:hypothetical protein